MTPLYRNASAYLNEVRGKLFEWAILRGLLEHWPSLRASCYEQLGERGLGQLLSYETYCLREAPLVLEQINEAAGGALECLRHSLPQEMPTSVTLASMQTLLKGSAEIPGAADLLLQFPPGPALGISLKTAKPGSFINTKSGGLQSFLSKYFGVSEAACQRAMVECQQAYHHFTQQLCFDLGIDPKDYLAIDHQSKVKSHIPYLPSDLIQPNHRAWLHQYYFQCSEALLKPLNALRQERPAYFKQRLAPLFGFSDHDLWLLLTPWPPGKNKSELYLGAQLNAEINQSDCELLRPSADSYLFFLYLPHYQLQVRVKPMRDFWSPSLKVNCAVRFHDKMG